MSLIRLPTHAPANPPQSASSVSNSALQPIISCPRITTNSQQPRQSHQPSSSSLHVTRALTNSPTAPSIAPTTSTPPGTSVPSPNSVSAAPRLFQHPILAPHDYMHTRSKSDIFIPKKHFNLSATVSISSIPASYHSALKDPDWHNTMRKEFHALMNQCIWDLVPCPGVNIVIGK
jgi:hypothetical protein